MLAHWWDKNPVHIDLPKTTKIHTRAAAATNKGSKSPLDLMENV